MRRRERGRVVGGALLVLAISRPATAQFLPFPPSELAAAVTAGSTVTLTWFEARRAERYVVDVGSAHGLSDLGSFDTGSPATTFSATNVPSGVYHVRVRARNTVGTSGPSNEVTIAVGTTCQLPTASNLVATVASGLVTLSWTSTNATSHRLEVGPAPGSFSYYDLALGAATTFTAPAPRGTYYLRVRGQNACGLGMPTADAILAVGVPGAPTDLTASVIGGTVRLRWNPPAAGAPANYFVSAGSAPWYDDYGGLPTSVTSVDVPGIGAGTYWIKVRGSDTGGLGPHSNSLPVTVGPPPADAIAVTFNALAPNGPAFTAHSENGYLVEAVSGPWRSGPALISMNPDRLVALDSEVRLTAVGGGAFRFVSARLYSSVTPIPYVFRGVRNGVTVYTVTATVPNTFGSYATVPNPYALIDVDTVFVTVTNPAIPTCPTCNGNPVGLDDLVVRPQ